MKMSHIPSLKILTPLPHIVAIKSIIHLNIKNFVMKKERIAISLLESQSVETDIFSNFQQPLCFVLWNISSKLFLLSSLSKKPLEKKTFTLFSSEIVGASLLHYVTTATLNEIDTSRLTA